MKAILFCIPFLFIGCCEPRVVIETKYIHQQIPDLQDKPTNKEVDFKVVQFNDTEMICLTKSDAYQLGQNWVDYRSWSDENFNILKTLKEQQKDIK